MGINIGVKMGVLACKSDNLHPYRVGLIDKGSYLEAKTTINEERRMRGSQLAKNYINWVDNEEVMATLVVEEWCKGTPLDTTIYRDTLYSNIHYNCDGGGLVVSLMTRGLIFMSFFRFLRVMR